MTTGGGTSSDWKLIDYASEIDEVDKLINQSRNTRDMLNYELKKKEREMRTSGDVYDKIYVYKWIEGRKPRYFNKLIGFSLSRTYDYIVEIHIYNSICTNRRIKNEKVRNACCYLHFCCRCHRPDRSTYLLP